MNYKPPVPDPVFVLKKEKETVTYFGIKETIIPFTNFGSHIVCSYKYLAAIVTTKSIETGSHDGLKNVARREEDIEGILGKPNTSRAENWKMTVP